MGLEQEGAQRGVVLRAGHRPAAEPEALEPVPGETITGPTPTPAVTPVERDKSTALLAALPDAVLQWAVSAQTVDDPAAVAAAAGVTGQPLEAYTLTYSDGSGDATTDVTVAVTQWRTPEAAAAYVAALGLEGTVSREEPVVVAGQHLEQGEDHVLLAGTGHAFGDLQLLGDLQQLLCRHALEVAQRVDREALGHVGVRARHEGLLLAAVLRHAVIAATAVAVAVATVAETVAAIALALLAVLVVGVVVLTLALVLPTALVVLLALSGFAAFATLTAAGGGGFSGRRARRGGGCSRCRRFGRGCQRQGRSSNDRKIVAKQN